MKPLTIGIVAGENSGDALGAALIASLKQRQPLVRFIGVTGPLMRQAGCESLFDIEALSIMSIVEVIRYIPRLVLMRRSLCRRFQREKVDVFIGVDAPEFNLGLAKKCRRLGIPTVQYNGPKLWAWRPWRVHKVAKSIDLMLVLFPFEQAIYAQHKIRCRFVGHPLANQWPLQPDAAESRLALGLSAHQPVLALLPGSRKQELDYLGPVFLATVEKLAARIPNLICLLPMVSEKRYQQIDAMINAYGKPLPIRLVRDQSHQVLRAADVVLVTSGTATFETMLLKKPMVVAYRMAWLSYWLAKLLVRCRYIALPNLLADDAIVPEYIQSQATAEHLAGATQDLFEQPAKREAMQQAFYQIHQALQQQISASASDAVLELLRHES